MRTGSSRKWIVAPNYPLSIINYPLLIEVACRAVSLIPSDKFVEWLHARAATDRRVGPRPPSVGWAESFQAQRLRIAKRIPPHQRPNRAHAYRSAVCH